MCLTFPIDLGNGARWFSGTNMGGTSRDLFDLYGIIFPTPRISCTPKWRKKKVKDIICFHKTCCFQAQGCNIVFVPLHYTKHMLICCSTVNMTYTKKIHARMKTNQTIRDWRSVLESTEDLLTVVTLTTFSLFVLLKSALH